jgi:hypothetical protein
MPDTTWKAAERAFARDLGTTRIPVTGERDGADAETPVFVVQVKHRAGEFPLTVARWLERVVAKARSRVPEKVGIVVIQRPRHRRLDALVVMTWKDFLDLHGSRPAAEEDERVFVLSEKAKWHIESGCPLPAGHDRACLSVPPPP